MAKDRSKTRQLSNLSQTVPQDTNLSKLQSHDLKSANFVGDPLMTIPNLERIRNDCVQVVTTVDDEKKANEIGKVLLETRLVACVQILGPIKSSCRWKGKIKKGEEWMCLANARTENYEKIEATIKNIHPYDLPEILAFPIHFGNSAYLSWIHEETTFRS